METIIGLGSAGCNIAEKFMQYPQYDVYRIDTDQRKGPKFKKIPERANHEEYEAKLPSLKTFFKDARPPYLFVVGGSGAVSGASLRVLEQLNSKDLHVLYIKSDTTLMSKISQLQDRVVFNVLQEYARSGVLKRMFVVDNSKLENIYKDIPVVGYYDKLNDVITNTIHMTNIFDNTKSVIDTFSDPVNSARISTLGLVDVNTGEENLFYDLTYPREKLYYYSITKERLETEGSLLRKLTDQVKSKIKGEMKVSFGIYSSDYDADYGYCVAHATLIQEISLD
tara:strand:+ start:9241 stop:10083 length:843 start_codon:yes stop_codon:yes gene_type:complete